MIKIKSDKEKGMNSIVKIALYLAGFCGVAGICIGIVMYEQAKEAEVKDLAQTVSTVSTEQQQSTELEQQVDESLKLNDEAERLWKRYSDKLTCDKSTFIEKYIDYKGQGLTAREAYNSIYGEFAVVEKANNDTQVADYEIDEIDAVNLYATESTKLYTGPNESDFTESGELQKNEEVTVVGIVKSYHDETVLWYQLDTGEFVNGGYLAEIETKTETVSETASSDTTESSGKTEYAAQMSETDREWYKANLGLSDAELDSMTEEKLDAIIEKWVNQQFSGGSSGSSSSSTSNENTLTEETDEEWLKKTPELGQYHLGGEM
jgi:hypothetical protein